MTLGNNTPRKRDEDQVVDEQRQTPLHPFGGNAGASLFGREGGLISVPVRTPVRLRHTLAVDCRDHSNVNNERRIGTLVAFSPHVDKH